MRSGVYQQKKQTNSARKNYRHCRPLAYAESRYARRNSASQPPTRARCDGSSSKQESATPAQSFWRLLTKFDSSKMSAYRALRNAAGVVLPLIGGFALGMPRGGLVVASSALNGVAFSDGEKRSLPAKKSQAHD